MKSYILALSAVLALSALGSAQTTKAKPNQDRIVKGTTQMAGDNGKLNTAYTIGKVDPINVTLTDVRYSLVREVVGNSVVAPSKDEKLLVMDFVAHNPNPKAIQFDGSALKFVGVDQEAVNRDYNRTFTRAKTGEVFSTDLKPAQKVELRTIIVAPAAGTVPKLILEHRTGGPVLRYDIKASLKPLPSAFADAKDETGMTASEILTGTADAYLSMGQIDIKLVPGSIETPGTRFGPNTVGAGKTFVTAKLVLRGQSPTPANLKFEGEFIDENGEKYPILKIAQVSTEDHVSRQLEMGQEYTVRFVSIMPEKVKLKTLRVLDSALGKPSRTYIFPLN